MGTTETKTEALVPITIMGCTSQMLSRYLIRAREVLVPMTVIRIAKPGRHLFPIPITARGTAKSQIEGLVPIYVIATTIQR